MARPKRTGIPTVPGDLVASIEEFESSDGTYELDGQVRAKNVGLTDLDLADRKIRLKGTTASSRLPQRGDTVIGLVESVQSNIAQIAISFLGDAPSSAGFTGMLSLREDRPTSERGHRRTVCKSGDMVRAQVISTENNIVHLSISGERLGVVYATCSVCGSSVVPTNRVLKCAECGAIEERELAPDFGATISSLISQQGTGGRA